MKIRLAPLAAAALAAGSLSLSLPAMAEGTKKRADTTASSQVAATTVTTSTFTTRAPVADLFEIEAGRIAVQRAQSPDVKAFAAMLVDHHTRSANDFVLAAKQSGVTLNTTRLDSAHMTKLRELRDASDAAFDNTFITQQIVAHKEALQLHQAYAQTGDKAALKQTAQRTAPVVQQHLEEAGRISVNLPKH